MPNLDFDDILKKALSQYYKLVLIVGKHKTGKTCLLKSVSQKYSVPVLNINLLLSEKLLNIPNGKRYLYVPDFFSEIVSEHNEIVLIDNIELLFDSDLKLNPLIMLQRLSRNMQIVCTWPGYIVKNKLIYADPAHSEYKEDEIKDFQVIDLNEDSYEI